MRHRSLTIRRWFSMRQSNHTFSIIRHAQLSFYARFNMPGCHFRHLKPETTKRNHRNKRNKIENKMKKVKKKKRHPWSLLWQPDLAPRSTCVPSWHHKFAPGVWRWMSTSTTSTNGIWNKKSNFVKTKTILFSCQSIRCCETPLQHWENLS